MLRDVGREVSKSIETKCSMQAKADNNMYNPISLHNMLQCRFRGGQEEVIFGTIIPTSSNILIKCFYTCFTCFYHVHVAKVAKEITSACEVSYWASKVNKTMKFICDCIFPL